MQTRKEIAALGDKTQAADKTIPKPDYNTIIINTLFHIMALYWILWTMILICFIGGLL